MLTREIHLAQKSLTEPSPEDKRSFAMADTEAGRSSRSPQLPRNKRRNATTGIMEDGSQTSKLERRRSMKVYGSKSSSEKDIELNGSGGEMQHHTSKINEADPDFWEFPSSGVMNESLAPRREKGSARVKSRNATGDPLGTSSIQGRLSSGVKAIGDHDGQVSDSNKLATIDSSQSGESNLSQKRPQRQNDFHGQVALYKVGNSSSLDQTAPLRSTDEPEVVANSSFKVDLTDPTLILSMSQKEQYQQLSATTSSAGSLPPPPADELLLIDHYRKWSDQSSTLPDSTPSARNQNGGQVIDDTSGLPADRTPIGRSVTSVPVHSPATSSQVGSQKCRTPRRSNTTTGVQSPVHDKPTSSMSTATAMPKRRSKTTSSVYSHLQASEGVSLDLTLPPSVQKSTKKRKAKEIEYYDHGDDLGSDDANIGLPKEQYKPRPSRSRRSTAVDELLENVDFSKRPEAQVKGKSKRRKTREADVQESKDETISQPIQVPEEEIADPLAVKERLPPLVSTNEFNSTTGVIGEREKRENHNVPKVARKRKRKMDMDEDEEEEPPDNHNAKQNIAPASTDAVTDHTLPETQSRPETKHPAPAARGRGRPRKKTEEIPTPKSAETVVDDKENEEPPGPVDDDTLPSHKKAKESTSVNKGSSQPQNTMPATRHQEPDTEPSTPQKRIQDHKDRDDEGEKDKASEKGPDKHSPLRSGRVPYRVGLSKRARIEPLLRIVRK